MRHSSPIKWGGSARFLSGDFWNASITVENVLWEGIYEVNLNCYRIHYLHVGVKPKQQSLSRLSQNGQNQYHDDTRQTKNWQNTILLWYLYHIADDTQGILYS